MYRFSLRMIGPSQELRALLEIISEMSIQYTIRKSEYRGRNAHQEEDTEVLVINLSDWNNQPIDAGGHNSAIPQSQEFSMSDIIDKMKGLTPAMSMMSARNMRKSFYISTIRKEEQGGFVIPPELVYLCSAYGLSIEISILVLLDD
jgi:hypothetical protein